MKYIYIASATPDGGIYRYTASEKGLTPVDFFSCPTPMYFVKEGNLLYVILRDPFEGKEESGLVVYRLEEDGKLTLLGNPVSTHGEVACHLAVKDGNVYIANYVSGSLCHVGGKTVVHSGKGPNPVRQEAPHVHSVILSPDGKYVLSADLGLDTIFVYDGKLNEVSKAKVPDGAGCRHLVFSRDGKFLYCVNELGSSVSVFAYCDGVLSLLSTVSTLLPETEADPDAALRLSEDGKKACHSIAAAIRLSEDGKKLYVTNRGENTVAVFEVDGATLSHLASYPTGGNEPRDFLLVNGENHAVVVNQFGNTVRCYAHKDGVLTTVQEFDLPAPLCIGEYEV